MTGLRILHGLNRTSAKNVRVCSDNKLKQHKIIEGVDISTHTTDGSVSFRVLPTDVHKRRLVPDDQSQPASEGLDGKRLDRFAQRCWLVSELRFFRSTLYGRPSNDQDEPESSSQCFAYPYFCPWWPVAPDRLPEHRPSPDGHWLRTAEFCCFE